MPPTLYSAGGPPPDKATVGFAYAGYTFVANGNPTPTYAYSPLSSTTPPGINVNAAGLLSGTPTTANTYPNLIVRATVAAAGPTAFLDTTPFTITVAPAIAFTTTSPLA